MNAAAGAASPLALADAACLLPTPALLAHVRAALALAPRLVLVVRRATAAPSPACPFTAQDRWRWLRDALPADDAARIDLLPLRELYDAARELRAIRRALPADAGPVHWLRAAAPGLDAPALPPGWTQQVAASDPDAPAGQALAALYAAEDPRAQLGHWQDSLGPAATQVLADWVTGGAPGEFERLRTDWRQIAHELRVWSAVPYPVVKVTVDTVVRAAGQVLLVRRGRPPGLGLWALPGGFLEPDEPVLDAALRELHEETGLPVPLADLHAAVRGQRAFTHPRRSQRGRIVTFTVFVDLPHAQAPPVQGGDDAAEARWVPVEALAGLEARLHDDHFLMLDAFLGLLPD